LVPRVALLTAALLLAGSAEAWAIRAGAGAGVARPMRSLAARVVSSRKVLMSAFSRRADRPVAAPQPLPRTPLPHGSALHRLFPAELDLVLERAQPGGERFQLVREYVLHGGDPARPLDPGYVDSIAQRSGGPVQHNLILDLHLRRWRGHVGADARERFAFFRYRPGRLSGGAPGPIRRFIATSLREVLTERAQPWREARVTEVEPIDRREGRYRVHFESGRARGSYELSWIGQGLWGRWRTSAVTLQLP
jgi:hypothetical protein